MKTRRYGRLLLAAAAALLVLTGCVDVVQYISGTGSTIDVYLRLTLNKGAFEMANSMSDEPEDLEQMFEEDFDLEEQEVLGQLPPGVDASFETVNDEFEYGFVLSYSADRGTLADLGGEAGAFVPQVGARGMTIPLAEGGEGGQAEGGQGDQFAAAFLGGSKYRVFVSRRLVSRISSAHLVTDQGSTEVSVIELPDVWMVQFPVALWLMSPSAPSLEIRY